MIARDVLPLHHKALISDAKGQDWIAEALDKKNPTEIKSLPEVMEKANHDWEEERDDEVVAKSLTTLAALGSKKSEAMPSVLPML